MRHRLFPAALIVLFASLPQTALAQTTVTYRLHNEASTINAARQLKPAGPDVAAVVRRSADLKGSSANWFLVLDYFETQSGVPNVAGTIPAGSVVTFSIWLRKTTAQGTFHPTAALHFNQYWGPVPGLCAAGQGNTSPLPKLTTTFTRYTFTCTIDTARTMTTADRFFAQVGAWVEAAPAHKSVQIELGLEGALNGNYDSTIAVPMPAAPVITTITPSSGPVGQTVTIDGQGFAATQGISTVAFNGTIAPVTSWSDTRIITSVPAGATSGPVVVTVSGRSSNGVAFSLTPPPAITALNPTSGIVGQQVTITGANFGSTQGASVITFNGTAATATSWDTTSIVTSVPVGAATGPVAVTVNGQSSDGIAFTVIPPPSIASLTPASGRVGDAVSIAGANFGASQGASTVRFNGVLATATSWSATAIGTSVPVGATTGTVIVTVNGQTSGGSSFTVLTPPVLTAIDPASGYAGDSVTISGSNLGPASSVTFNGVPATITTATATTITATVPQQATTGPVVVTVNGQSSNGLPFTVLTSQTATVNVRAYLFDDTAPGGQGAAAGPGVYITVDGEPVGRTAADGTLTVTVQAGERVVAATVPSTSRGEKTVTLGAGGSTDVSVVLLDGGDVTESTPLVVAEVADGLLQLASPSFTMEFLRNGTRVPIDVLERVDVLDRHGDLVWELSDMFEVMGGRMLATDPAWFFVWLPIVEPTVLRVQAVDADGFTHVNSVEFSVGQLALNLTLAAPPSTPALTVAGIEVTVAVSGTPIVFHRTTDADGRIALPLLPNSTLSVSAEKQAGGDFFYGQASVLLTADTSATLVMRNLTDIVNGVPPLSVSSGAFAAMASSADTTARAAASQTWAVTMSQQRAALTAAEDEPSVSVIVTSDGQGEPVQQTAPPLTVAKGTEKVTLKYNVSSAEYPDWVRKKSPYDDVWIITVFAGRQQLFSTTQRVNAQLTGEPTWQADGTTGEIQQEIDVKVLATDQDIQLTLFASSENIKDHLFPTTVNAVLGAKLKLAINKVEKEAPVNGSALTPTPADPSGYVRPTKGDGTFYSIPASGTNFFERWFTLTVTKPADTTVERVSLTLKDAGGTILQTLLTDKGDDSPDVEILEEGKKIRVRASLHTVASGVPSTPPPTHYLRYEFVVKGTANSQAVESDPKSPSEMNALWRMPQIFPRYSQRETGRDDWASRGAYAWLTANSGIMKAINDISGEHALDLHHNASHRRGIDIDMFHIIPFNSNKSGQENYEMLRDKVFAALGGDAAAKADVTAWVTGSRTGLDALLNLADVRVVIYAVGTSWTQTGITLPGGWAETLIRSGTLTVGTLTLDTGAAAWTNTRLSKFSCDAIHNSHVHIGLDDTKLIK